MLAGGVHQGQYDLHRRKTPPSVVQDRFMVDRIAELGNFVQPRSACAGEGFIVSSIVVVNVKACCGLADFATFAGDDDHSCVGGGPVSIAARAGWVWSR